MSDKFRMPRDLSITEKRGDSKHMIAVGLGYFTIVFAFILLVLTK